MWDNHIIACRRCKKRREKFQQQRGGGGVEGEVKVEGLKGVSRVLRTVCEEHGACMVCVGIVKYGRGPGEDAGLKGVSCVLCVMCVCAYNIHRRCMVFWNEAGGQRRWRV